MRKIIPLLAALIAVHGSMAQYSCLEFHDGGGTSWDDLLAIAADTDGGTYLAGLFNGSMQLGGQVVTGNAYNAFVAKLDDVNALVWAQVFTSDANSFATALALDGAGGLVVVGQFQALSFGDCSLSNSGSDDVFIAKLNANDGGCQWVVHGSSVGFGRAADVAIAPDGGLRVVGDFAGSINLGGVVLNSISANDAYVAAYAPDGTPLWARQVLDPVTSLYQGVAVDASGATFAVGQHGTTADLGDGVSLSSTGSQAFIAKYDGVGTVSWARQSGYNANTESYGSVACGQAGEAYVLRNGPAGVIKYAADGDSLWGSSISADLSTEGGAFGVHMDEILFAPHFANEVVVGADTLTTPDGTTGFALMKMNTDGDLVDLRDLSDHGLSSVFPTALAFDAQGGPVLGGYYYCSSSSQPDTVLGLGCHGVNDFFYMQECNGTVTGIASSWLNVPIAYPNPFHDEVSLQLPTGAQTPRCYRLLDVCGREILNTRSSDLQTTLNCSALSNGLYALQIAMPDGQVQVLRLVRE